MSDFLHVSSSPHVRSKVSTDGIMKTVLLALLPTTLFGIYNFGLHALLLILVCMATCVATEAVYEKIVNKKSTIKKKVHENETIRFHTPFIMQNIYTIL